MQKHMASSAENKLGIGIFPEIEKSWFEIDHASELRIQTQEPETFFFEFALTLNRDIVYHTRSIYSFFDLLGDVGGLFDALKGIASVVVSLSFTLFGNPMEKYLLSAVFKREKGSNNRDQVYKPRLLDKIQSLLDREPFRIPSYCCL